jgi:hypothetical protein
MTLSLIARSFTADGLLGENKGSGDFRRAMFKFFSQILADAASHKSRTGEPHEPARPAFVDPQSKNCQAPLRSIASYLTMGRKDMHSNRPALAAAGIGRWMPCQDSTPRSPTRAPRRSAPPKTTNKARPREALRVKCFACAYLGDKVTTPDQGGRTYPTFGLPKSNLSRLGAQ